MDDERSCQTELIGVDGLMDLAPVSFRTTDERPPAILGDSDILTSEIGYSLSAILFGLPINSYGRHRQRTIPRCSARFGNIVLDSAIPINDATRVISDFIESGSVSHSWSGVQTETQGRKLARDIGITVVPANDDIRELHYLKRNDEGIFITGVKRVSAAGSTGLQQADLITVVNGDS